MKDQPRARVVLGGYPAKQCPRAVHNRFSPAAPPEPEVDEDTQDLYEAGQAFEAMIGDVLGRVPGAVLLSDDDGPEETLAAMRAGAPVIVNGRLPRTGSKAGAPDVLVRFGTGYLPVDIKLHGTRSDSARKTLPVSTLAEPAVLREAPLTDAGGYAEGDGFQLAHYTRMLQGLGFHPGDDHLIGGIIGQSDYTDLGGSPWLITWYDLDLPRKQTYSATSETGRAKRSLLKRYDHEFTFRLEVAETAKAGGELVRPFHVAECGGCAWFEHCEEVAGPADASFSICAGLPTAQQWRLLHDAGIATVDDLAAQDPLASPDGWSPRDTQPGSRAEGKFETLVRRAQLARDGRDFAPWEGWPEVPSADIEVDFDIEWDFENRIYLWGLRVREGHDEATARFDPVAHYGHLDDVGAARLAAEFAAKLGALIEEANAAGKALAIYHWSYPEVSARTFQFPEVAAVLEGRTFDLCAWWGEHFVTRWGNSIKVVAPIFGFGWQVEEAGGAESQLRIEAARHGGPEAEAARLWLHRYNESDVAAQAAIRDGVRRAAQG